MMGWPQKARGRALTALALDLGITRRGFWEHVPFLGDYLLRKRVRRERFSPMLRQGEDLNDEVVG